MVEMDVKSLYDTVLFLESLTTKEYKEKYVDIEVTQKACNECPNHNRNWACPEFTDDQLKTWDKYRYMDLYYLKIIFKKEVREKQYNMDELRYIVDNSLFYERNRLIGQLEMVEKVKNGRYLSAGYCSVCESCSRIDGKPCRYPDKCHFSIESIGGLVDDTIKGVFDEELKWIDEDGHLPENLSLMMAIVYS